LQTFTVININQVLDQNSKYLHRQY